MPEHSPQLSLIEQVDAECDRYEAAFRAGQNPRMEVFLETVAPSVRAALFQALLELDIELRKGQGERPVVSDYEGRFPEEGKRIQAIFEEAQRAGSLVSSVKLTGVETSQGPEVKAASPKSSAVSPPKKLGRFEIRSVLGEGAFGTVYRARDPQLDRDVALKVPRFAGKQSREERERFLREARAAAGLHQAHICPVHEVGTIDGRDYIVLAYIDGKPLSKLLQTQPKLSGRQIAAVVRKLALALQEAHDQGIIHRDLKPANIMINRKGEPVIMDFGLARRENSGDAQISHSGQIMGTPAYMSPEQARGDGKAVGPASDIYSLGVVLYELLCGRRPFEGTVTEVIGQILHVEPPQPSQFRSDVDPRLQAICMRAIAKTPSERYSSMKEFATALADYARTTPSEQRPSAPPVETRKEIATNQFADLLAAISSDVESKVERAVGKAGHVQRIPWWTYLVGSGLMGLIVLLGIFFFIKKDTVTVIVNIPIENINDPSLSFLLDKNPIEAAAFAAPIELTPGRHELVVNKDGQLFKRFTFSVGAQQSDPVVVQDVTPEVPMSALEDSFVSLFNGQDLSGWLVETGDKDQWKVQSGAILGIGHDGPPQPHMESWLLSEKEYRDFILRLEFKADGNPVNSGVAIRAVPQEKPPVGEGSFAVPTHLQFEIFSKDIGNSAPTGTLIGSLQPLQTIRSNPTTQKPDKQWNSMEIEVRGQSVRARLNDSEIMNGDLDDLLAQGAKFPGLKRTSGRIGLQRLRGTIQFRDIQIKELPPSDEGWIELFNGKDLSNWVTSDGKTPQWKVEHGYMEVVPGSKSIVTRDNYPLDFELQVEFWLPKELDKKDQSRANSGVFLHGRHEVQICDGYQNPIVKPLTACGGLFGEIAPSANACTAPETWQSFNITYHSPRAGAEKTVTQPGRLTVVHNGQRIVDGGSFQSMTGANFGRHNGNLGLPGPIMLQDHGSPVRFRNIRLRPIAPYVEAHHGWTNLFNGKDFTGWNNPNKVSVIQGWAVKDGSIVRDKSSPTDAPGGVWQRGNLWTQRRYEDFVLELEFRGTGTNTLVIRADQPNNDYSDRGLHIPLNLRGTPGNYWWLGTFYPFKSPKSEPRIKDDWNQLRLTAVGPKITVDLNGETINSIDLDRWVSEQTGKIDPDLPKILQNLSRSGHIGFNAREGEISLRNIRIKEIGKPVVSIVDDPDRKAAESLLSLGPGFVKVNGQDRQIRQVNGLPKEPFRLTGVYFADVKTLDDNTLAVLKDCVHLTELDLRSTRVTEKGLEIFRGKTNFTSLGLAYLRVTDTGLEIFKGNQRLRMLFLHDTYMTDKGLSLFHDCKELDTVWVGGTPITDAGMLPFRECRFLKWLDVRATKVTREGVQTMKAALPACRVDADPNKR